MPTEPWTFGEATKACDWDQSPRPHSQAVGWAAPASLFIEVLGLHHPCRGRGALAALMGERMILIDNDPRGRGIGPGGTCTQRIEACFLLVAEPVVEFRERGLHG